MADRSHPSVARGLLAFRTPIALYSFAQHTDSQRRHRTEVAPEYADVVSDAVQTARGIYLTGPWIRQHTPARIIDVLRDARMTAAVIDLRDATGRVHIDSRVPELAEQETGMLGDTRALLSALREAGIHTIARISCFNDPQLAVRFPDRAILHNRRGDVWQSWGTGGPWLDPWDQRNHDLVVTLSEEAEALGFAEIQLDYIRFPVDDGVQFARYPHEVPNVRRRDLLLGLLRRVDAAVHIPLGVDVFGIAAYWEGDRAGLGQDLEVWSDYVDVYTPMLYLRAMRNWSRGQPDRATTLVQIGVERLRARLGPKPIIRPFLQAFELESDGMFGPPFIADQIRGARNGGADGFLFWHPASNYGVVQNAMVGVARQLTPFEIPAERTAARR